MIKYFLFLALGCGLMACSDPVDYTDVKATALEWEDGKSNPVLYITVDNYDKLEADGGFALEINLKYARTNALEALSTDGNTVKIALSTEGDMPEDPHEFENLVFDDIITITVMWRTENSQVDLGTFSYDEITVDN